MVKNLLSEVMVKKVKPKQLIDAASLTAAIESGYLGVRQAEFKTKKSFSPSTLVWGSGACPRYWHLAFSGAVFEGDGERDPKSIASMANGTASHERIQAAMSKAGVLKEGEVRVTNDDPPIFGFCDGIIEWEGKTIPIEIKTIREESFAYRKVQGTAADYHIAQLLFYMRELKGDLGVVIYESKNSHELLIIPIEMTEERSKWLDEVYGWMQETRQTWKNGQLAIKPYRSNSKVCKGCPLKDDCVKAPAGDVTVARMPAII